MYREEILYDVQESDMAHNILHSFVFTDALSMQYNVLIVSTWVDAYSWKMSTLLGS